MRISDWSPDVCSSYLRPPGPLLLCLWIKMVGLSSLGGGRLQPESSFPARWKPAFSAVIQESGFLPAQGRRIRSSGALTPAPEPPCTFPEALRLPALHVLPSFSGARWSDRKSVV